MAASLASWQPRPGFPEQTDSPLACRGTVISAPSPQGKVSPCCIGFWLGNERASWSTKAVLAKSSQFFHLAQRGFTGRTMLAPQGACSAGATYFGCKHWQVLHPLREL